MKYVCIICAKEFTGISKNSNKYCSYDCRNKAYRKGKYIDCKICKTSFWVKPFQLKRGQGIYCSVPCRRKGRQGFAYKTVEEYTCKDRKKRLLLQLLTQRDGKRCKFSDCVWNITLEIHRIKPGKEGGEYTLENTCLLCPNHHTAITKKRINMPV